jgi:hypothetical protein
MHVYQSSRGPVPRPAWRFSQSEAFFAIGKRLSDYESAVRLIAAKFVILRPALPLACAGDVVDQFGASATCQVFPKRAECVSTSKTHQSVDVARQTIPESQLPETDDDDVATARHGFAAVIVNAYRNDS